MTGILFLFLLSFLLLGPKKTSELARQLGGHIASWKRTANGLQAQLASSVAIQTPGPVSENGIAEKVFDLVTSGAFIPEKELQSCAVVKQLSDESSAVASTEGADQIDHSVNAPDLL